MSAAALLPGSRRRRALRALASPRAALIAHLISLALGAALLLYLGKDQWFFFDEWDFIWPDEGLRRLVEGHNGHWSLVPIAIWLALQQTLGLASYLPFLTFAIAAHLVTAHLLWRLLRRTRCDTWLSTAVIAVFVCLGAGSENLLWAFQVGYVGAIAFALGAVLLVSRRELTAGASVWAGALLALGAASSGTALPFFAAVGIVGLRLHGWRRTALILVPPSLIYLAWLVVLAGENPTSVYRASGVADSLRGIPVYVARMFVDGLTTVTPVPAFGIVLVTAIVVWIVLRLRSGVPSPAETIALAMLVAGLTFAVLTAYSRLQLGTDAAASSRYVYYVVVAVLPAITILLTRVASRRVLAFSAVAALIAAVGVFNVGVLVEAARTEAGRERTTHALISAALALADTHPDGVDLDATPDPQFLSRTLGEVRVLERDFGLTRIDFSDAERLTALVNVGLVTREGAASGEECTPLAVGDSLSVPVSGTILRADDDATIVSLVAAEREVRSDPRQLTLARGTTSVMSATEVELVVESLSGAVSRCSVVDADADE